MVAPGCECPDATVNALDDGVGRGCTSRDADGVGREEPFRPEVGLGLDVMDPRTVEAARVHQLACVGAARAADDDDHVGTAGQVDGGVLALLCRVADRVHETNIGLGESESNELDEVTHSRDRLRRLSGNADARMPRALPCIRSPF